jgi:hypothetical protein
MVDTLMVALAEYQDGVYEVKNYFTTITMLCIHATESVKFIGEIK